MTIRRLALVILCFSIAACGKKAPPTMKAYEVPAAPQKLSALHRDAAIIVSWVYDDKYRSAIKGFHILRSEGGLFGEVAFVKADQGSFADRGYSLNTSYQYKVVAESLRNVMSRDSELMPVTPKPLPQPPAHIKISAGPASLDLSWSTVGEGICYNIYKSKEKGRYGDIPLNPEAVCGTAYPDSVLSPEVTVYYTVRSLLNTSLRDEGSSSPEVEASPDIFIPSPPTSLAVVSGKGRRFLVWQESPESWVRGYRIYRKGGGENSPRSLGESRTPSFVDSEDISGKFEYSVKALGPVKESLPLSTDFSVDPEKDTQQ